MSVMEWPGWLKCDGTAAVALAWSGLFWIVLVTEILASNKTAICRINCQTCVQFCSNSHFKWRLALTSLH